MARELSDGAERLGAVAEAGDVELSALASSSLGRNGGM